MGRIPHRPPRAGVFRLSETPFAAARLERAERLPQGSQRPPLHRSRPESTPTGFRPLRHDDACVVLVPSSPFLPASTVSSSGRVVGLLHPTTDPGVHRVSAPRRRMPAVASARPHRCLPSRAFPSREAVIASPRSAAPLPSTGNAGAATRPFSARESVATTVRGRTTPLDALLGFPPGTPLVHEPSDTPGEGRRRGSDRGPARSGPDRRHVHVQASARGPTRDAGEDRADTTSPSRCHARG